MTAAVAEGSDDGVHSPEELEAEFGAWAELKPCPFCGSAAGLTVIATAEGRVLSYAKCLPCGILGPSGRSRVEAVAAWNRRSP